MPFTGTTFAYTNPTAATGAVAGQVVQSAVWDQVHTDIQSALNQIYPQAVSMTTLRNFIWMNGGLEVWQRDAGGAASFSVTATGTQYTADRWYILTASASMTIQTTTGLTLPSNLAAKIQRNNANTGVGTNYFAYPIDTNEFVRTHGLKVQLSFVVKPGANWSGGSLSYALYGGTGAVTKANAAAASFTNAFTILSGTVALSAGGAAQAVTSAASAATIPTTTTQMELQFAFTPTGTAGADDSFSLDDVQVEGLNATNWAPTNFDRLPQEVELLGCKRHYLKTFNYATAPAAAVGLAGAPSVIGVVSQALMFFWDFPVDMRTAPTVTTFNPLQTGANWESVSASVDSTSIAVQVRTSNAGTKGIAISSLVTASVATNSICYIHITADAGI